MTESSVFNASSLKNWLAKKPVAFKAAVEKRMHHEKDRSLIEGEMSRKLSSLFHMCTQPESIEKLCRFGELQGELLFLLSQVPFSARLRFLELIAAHSLKLVMTLMDEKIIREHHQKAAQFVFHSLKHAFALKTLYEIFDPLRLSRVALLLEEKKDDI